MPRSRARPAAVLLLLALLVAACSGDPSVAPSPSSSAPPYAIRFASYDFRENQILVEVYAEAARRAGLPVEVDHGIGTREVVSPALMQGRLTEWRAMLVVSTSAPTSRLKLSGILKTLLMLEVMYSASAPWL